MEREVVGEWREELDDFMRAISGAFLFGVPLLFTMEMWWIGSYAEPWKLATFLAAAFAVNAVLAHFAGFKRGTTIPASLAQAVEAVAFGAVASVVVLIVLNRISVDDPLNSIVGKVIIQTIPLSIGASVANAIFLRGEGRQGDDAPATSPARATLNDLSATVAGGIFIGFSIAPTEEIKMLATELDRWHELALVGLSLLVSYLIVFESEFSPRRFERAQPGPFQRPITETSLAYVVSLTVALVALLLFDQITVADPPGAIASQMIVLGFPTAIGGAAGRLVI